MMVYVAILLWAGLLAVRVYHYDLYQKAPWAALLLALACGYGAMGVVGRLEDLTLNRLDIRSEDMMGLAIVAATHEELAKLLLVAVIAVALHRWFNDPLDGLIYGAFTGLGMGLEESVFYLSLVRIVSVEVIGLELVRVFLHMLLGGLSAFAVGMAATRMKHWPVALAGWWTAATALHFLWDYAIALPLAKSSPWVVGPRLTAVALLLTTVASFGGSVLLASRWSRNKFDPDSQVGIWGWPFAQQALPRSTH